VHRTDFALPPTLIVFGLKSKLDTDGAMMSSGTAVTATLAAGANEPTLPT
jgi:hypothetical protein